MPNYVHIVGYVEGDVPGEEACRVVRSHFFPSADSWTEIANQDLLSCLHQTERYIEQDGYDPAKCVLVAVMDGGGNDLFINSKHSVYMRDAINMLKEDPTGETE